MRYFLFEIGPHLFDFVKPVTDKSPLVEWLETRGTSPYAATLRKKTPEPVVLDPELTHGAGLSLE